MQKTSRLQFAKELEVWWHRSDGVCRVPSELSQENPSDWRIPTVKKRSGSGMTCGYMSAKGVGGMTFIDGTTAACGYTKQKNTPQTWYVEFQRHWQKKIPECKTPPAEQRHPSYQQVKVKTNRNQTDFSCIVCRSTKFHVASQISFFLILHEGKDPVVQK